MIARASRLPSLLRLRVPDKLSRAIIHRRSIERFSAGTRGVYVSLKIAQRHAEVSPCNFDFNTSRFVHIIEVDWHISKPENPRELPNDRRGVIARARCCIVYRDGACYSAGLSCNGCALSTRRRERRSAESAALRSIEARLYNKAACKSRPSVAARSARAEFDIVRRRRRV